MQFKQKVNDMPDTVETELKPCRKFRKKPVVIEAFQMTDDLATNHIRDGIPLQFGLLISNWGGNIHRREIDYWKLWLETPEGRMKVSPNDWIIKGIKGEIYPCKPDIFEATYEDADEQVTRTTDTAKLLAELAEAKAIIAGRGIVEKVVAGSDRTQRLEATVTQLLKDKEELETMLREVLPYIFGNTAKPGEPTKTIGRAQALLARLSPQEQDTIDQYAGTSKPGSIVKSAEESRPVTEAESASLKSALMKSVDIEEGPIIPAKESQAYSHVAEIPNHVLQIAFRDGWYNDPEAWKKWAADTGNKRYQEPAGPMTPGAIDWFDDDDCYEKTCWECEKSFTGNDYRVLCKNCSNLLKSASEQEKQS